MKAYPLLWQYHTPLFLSCDMMYGFSYFIIHPPDRFWSSPVRSAPFRCPTALSCSIACQLIAALRRSSASHRFAIPLLSFSPPCFAIPLRCCSRQLHSISSLNRSMPPHFIAFPRHSFSKQFVAFPYRCLASLFLRFAYHGNSFAFHVISLPIEPPPIHSIANPANPQHCLSLLCLFVALRFLALPSRRFAIPSPVFAFTAVPCTALPFLCLSDQLSAFPSHGISVRCSAVPSHGISILRRCVSWLILGISAKRISIALLCHSMPLLMMQDIPSHYRR